MKKVSLKSFNIVSTPGFGTASIKMTILPNSKNRIRKAKIQNLFDFFDKSINNDNEKII